MKSESIRNWKEWGKKDPYYGVLSEEKFRMQHLSDQAIGEFFETGESYVSESRKRVLRCFGVDISEESILDFGCGVGRLAIPFAKMTGKEVWGIDISEDIIDLATDHKQAFGLDHLKFTTYNGRELKHLPSFGFVHSYIVFQHIEPKLGMRLMRQLLEHTRVGGVFQVQVTFGHRLPWSVHANFFLRTKFQPYNFLYSSLKHRKFCQEPVMQMNHYSPDKLFRLFSDYSKEVQVEFTDHGGHLGAFYLLQKTTSV